MSCHLHLGPHKNGKAFFPAVPGFESGTGVFCSEIQSKSRKLADKKWLVLGFCTQLALKAMCKWMLWAVVCIKDERKLFFGENIQPV